jgi:hypothetical protein
MLFLTQPQSFSNGSHKNAPDNPHLLYLGKTSAAFLVPHTVPLPCGGSHEEVIFRQILKKLSARTVVKWGVFRIFPLAATTANKREGCERKFDRRDDRNGESATTRSVAKKKDRARARRHGLKGCCGVDSHNIDKRYTTH